MATGAATKVMESLPTPSTQDDPGMDKMIEEQIEEELMRAEEQAQRELEDKQLKDSFEEEKVKNEKEEEEEKDMAATKSPSSDDGTDDESNNKKGAVLLEQAQQVVSSILDIVIASACSDSKSSKVNSTTSMADKPTAIVSPQEKALKEVERIEVTAKKMFEDPGRGNLGIKPMFSIL